MASSPRARAPLAEDVRAPSCPGVAHELCRHADLVHPELAPPAHAHLDRQEEVVPRVIAIVDATVARKIARQAERALLDVLAQLQTVRRIVARREDVLAHECSARGGAGLREARARR